MNVRLSFRSPRVLFAVGAVTLALAAAACGSSSTPASDSSPVDGGEPGSPGTSGADGSEVPPSTALDSGVVLSTATGDDDDAAPPPCDGGTITGSRCLEVLAPLEDLEVYLGLAITGGTAYMTTGFDGVVKVPLAGGAVTTLVPDNTSEMLPALESPLALAGANVVWATQAGVLQAVALSGGTVTSIAPGTAVTSAFATIGTYVFWSPATTGPEALMKSAVTGGAATTVLANATAGDLIAADSSFLYFFDDVFNVTKVPAAGGPTIALASAPGGPRGIVTDGTNVYWGAGDGSVSQVSVDGGTTLVLTTTQGGDPTNLATDGTHLYWSNDNGQVERVRIGGGTVETIATPSELIGGLAVDSTSVYWTGERVGLTKLTPK